MIQNDKLKIYAPEVDRSKLQYELHTIKSMLPKVIVKVSYTLIFGLLICFFYYHHHHHHQPTFIIFCLKGIPTVERAVINEDKGVYNLLVEGLVTSLVPFSSFSTSWQWLPGYTKTRQVPRNQI